MQNIAEKAIHSGERKSVRERVYGRMVVYLIVTLAGLALLNNLGVVVLTLQAGAMVSITVSLALGFSELILRSKKDTMKLSKGIGFLAFIPVYMIVTGMKIGPMMVGDTLSTFALGVIFLTGWLIVGLVYLGKCLSK